MPRSPRLTEPTPPRTLASSCATEQNQAAEPGRQRASASVHEAAGGAIIMSGKKKGRRKHGAPSAMQKLLNQLEEQVERVSLEEQVLRRSATRQAILADFVAHSVSNAQRPEAVALGMGCQTSF